MKNDLTELVFILDRSGSMCSMTADTIGGFNSMLEKQKNEPGEALVSTVLFNDRQMLLHDRKSISQIENMTERDYVACGSTALLDAVGSTIKHIAGIHRYARAEDVPEHTVFIITTDGMENASRCYSAEKVRSMIEHEKEKYGWEFIFLGANIDAVETAASIGIGGDRAANFISDSQGTALNYAAISEAVKAVRCSKPLSADWKSSIDRDFKSRKV